MDLFSALALLALLALVGLGAVAEGRRSHPADRRWEHRS
jgi:hypothetical protein